MKRITTKLVLSAIILSLSATADAAVIYSDNFDGAATTLNGVAPDMRPGSETWASGNINADGSVVSPANTSWLTHTFEEDTEYTLSLTSAISYQATSTTPVYLGFTENSPVNTGNMIGATQSTYGIFAVYRGGGYKFQPGPNNDTAATAIGADNELFTESKNVEMQLVLSTYSTVNWTIAGYVDGVQVDLDDSSAGLLYTFAEARTFTAVGMGYHSSSYNAEAFELSAVAIPESSTFALLSGCLALTAVMVRRRQS